MVESSVSSSTDEQLETLQDKCKRISQLLHDLQNVSASCEQLDDDPELQEKKVFVRRILQVCAEIQDCRDVLRSLCESRLSERQISLAPFDHDNLNYSDPSLDPSVRFFGLDWEQIFGRCFNVSLNIRIFVQHFPSASEVDETTASTVDLVALNAILKDLAHIEADVTSHGDAVLNGRLSKSQQKLMHQEQLRLNMCAATSRPRNPVSKSRSFRTSSGRQMTKYKKNKTTDFDKLVNSNFDQSESTCPSRKQSVTSSPMPGARKQSFIQSAVSAIFKNIR